jgi:DNA-binding transcriptional ArsR family regulator
MDARNAEDVACLMKAIAHPVRLQVLALLHGGEENVSQLSATLGVHQASLSGHLAILRLNGLVEVRRASGFAWYRLDRPRLSKARAWLDTTCEEV